MLFHFKGFGGLLERKLKKTHIANIFETQEITEVFMEIKLFCVLCQVIHTKNENIWQGVSQKLSIS